MRSLILYIKYRYRLLKWHVVIERNKEILNANETFSLYSKCDVHGNIYNRLCMPLQGMYST